MSPLVELRGVSKAFGPTRALSNVSLAIHPGEVHVLAGSNGAGKSTLIRILSGVVGDYSGEILLGGAPVRLSHPSQAARAGIATIHQELSLVGAMSVADNLALGVPGSLFGLRGRARADEALASVGLSIDPAVAVERLPLSTRQLVEIARALASGARVLVMDEPTSALGEGEAERLFARVDALRAGGCGILYISHRMEEIERLADRVSVLRDGRLVASAPEMSRETIVRHMVGRDLVSLEGVAPPGEEILVEVRDLAAGFMGGIDLDLRCGEIVGLYGLEGSGAALLPRLLFGAVRRERGTIRLGGRLFEPRPSRSIAAGMIFLAGDRALSLVGATSVAHNASLSSLGRLSRWGFVARRAERTAVEAMVSRLRVVTASLDAPAWQLSGGNQQKVALARGLLTSPSVLLLDEPTRGIDVGAKRDVHAVVRELARGGAGVVVSSSELDELMLMSHRIAVFARGRIVRWFSREAFSREAIVGAATSELVEAAS